MYKIFNQLQSRYENSQDGNVRITKGTHEVVPIILNTNEIYSVDEHSIFDSVVKTTTITKTFWLFWKKVDSVYETELGQEYNVFRLNLRGGGFFPFYIQKNGLSLEDFRDVLK